MQQSTPAETTERENQPKPAQAGEVPPTYAAALEDHQRRILPVAPPTYATTTDWSLSIPHYQKYLTIKIVLGALAVAISAAIIGLAKAFADQSWPYRNEVAMMHTDSTTYGAVCQAVPLPSCVVLTSQAQLAIIWTFFEFFVLFAYKHKKGHRRGINPGGHVLFHIVICALAITSTVESVAFLNTKAETYYRDDTPMDVREGLLNIQRALMGLVLVLLVISFTFLARACIETWQINKGAQPPKSIHMAAMPQEQP